MVERQTLRTAGMALGAAAAGFLAFVLLFPASGVDPVPPKCFSMFGYSVPCGAGLSFSVGLGVALVAGVGLAALENRRRSRLGTRTMSE